MSLVSYNSVLFVVLYLNCIPPTHTHTHTHPSHIPHTSLTHIHAYTHTLIPHTYLTHTHTHTYTHTSTHTHTHRGSLCSSGECEHPWTVRGYPPRWLRQTTWSDTHWTTRSLCGHRARSRKYSCPCTNTV